MAIASACEIRPERSSLGRIRPPIAQARRPRVGLAAGGPGAAGPQRPAPREGVRDRLPDAARAPQVPDDPALLVDEDQPAVVPAVRRRVVRQDQRGGDGVDGPAAVDLAADQTDPLADTDPEDPGGPRGGVHVDVQIARVPGRVEALVLVPRHRRLGPDPDHPVRVGVDGRGRRRVSRSDSASGCGRQSCRRRRRHRERDSPAGRRCNAQRRSFGADQQQRCRNVQFQHHRQSGTAHHSVCVQWPTHDPVVVDSGGARPGQCHTVDDCAESVNNRRQQPGRWRLLAATSASGTRVVRCA